VSPDSARAVPRDKGRSNTMQQPAIDSRPAEEDEEEVERRQQILKNQAAIQLLDSWLQEEITPEKQAAWEQFKQVMNEDRAPEWQIFP